MWARVEDGKCIEFIGFEPVGKFHPEIAWVAVPEHLEPWVDASWVVEGGAIRPESLADLRERIKARVAARRWAAQAQGVRVGEYMYHTDAEGRAAVAEAMKLAELHEAQAGAGSWSTTWKTMGKVGAQDQKFVTMTLADLVQVGFAMGAYVQACFLREAALCAALDEAQTAEDMILIYETQAGEGWPENA